ncbi:alpha/beta fold hydrolase [Streptomyces sp. NPDC052023]|uniref:alpha/beta fold hydrolase n=1 Tax=Streptomyces sp. NPDC052023 TaxID=3365681 RepID=UPI0037D8B793
MTWTGSGSGSKSETVTADDGTRLWATRSGRGAEPLVLCHGGPGLWDMFEDVAVMLSDRATVIRWDQRGCGRSERCAGPWTTQRFVADLDAVRRHFGLTHMTLLGHSWGARLALDYTLAHPGRVNALAYVAGTGIGPDEAWQPGYRRNFLTRLGRIPEHLARWHELTSGALLSHEEEREQAVLRWSAEFVDPERGMEHARRMADPWFGVNSVCNRSLMADSRRAPGIHQACRTLDVPVLVLDGAQDIRPRSAVDSLEQALPRVRRVSLSGAGHQVWVEDPAGFRQAVEDVLA